jgi:hypothetical protein
VSQLDTGIAARADENFLSGVVPFEALSWGIVEPHARGTND